MPDDLYERDILAWSDQQADLIRRLARGERVNNVDWTNIAEEIESVGRSDWHALESFLTQLMVHLLKLHAWPDSDAAMHWRGEVEAFQQEAERRFAPSMRQRIDIPALYAKAVRQVRALDPSIPAPADCPWTLDNLLQDEREPMLERLAPPP
jgi:hypothetical protein